MPRNELTHRAHDTYRSARRAEWRAIKPQRPAWADFNGKLPKYSIGSVRQPRRVVFSGDRSKYIPHIGAKQISKKTA